MLICLLVNFIQVLKKEYKFCENFEYFFEEGYLQGLKKIIKWSCIEDIHF